MEKENSTVIIIILIVVVEIYSIGTLRNYDGDCKENVKKTIGLMSKTTTLHVHHAFLYISLLCLHNNDVK